MNKIENSFYEITASSVERYLLLKGWNRNLEFKNPNLMVFYNEKLNKKIALPSSETFEDFYQNLKDIIQVISLIEHRPISEIIKEILTVYFDRLEFRISSPASEDGKLPLDYASKCIEGLKELILYSACAEQSKQPICFRTTNLAKESLDNFKLAQTDVGSFVINIDSKVVNENHEQMTLDAYTPMPMEHKIVERINTAISQVNSVVDQKQNLSDIALNAYETGITANMCESLLKLKPLSGGVNIDTTIRYASALTKKITKDNHYTIKDLHFLVFDELSKIYRNKTLYQDVVLKGLVKALSKKEIEDTTTQSIKLLTKIEGHFRAIIMDLSDNDFRLACDSIKDDRTVEVAGELDMSNRTWIISNIKYFKVLE